MTAHTGTARRAGIALSIGVAFPFVRLAWECRATAALSEACVWGRAYFPLMRWVEPLIVAPTLFLVLTIVARSRRRVPGPPAGS